MAINSGVKAEMEMIGFLFANLPAGFVKNQNVFHEAAANNRPNGSPYLTFIRYPTLTVNVGAVGCYQRTTGQFVIGVFYPIGQGSLKASETAEALEKAFTNQHTDSVLFNTVQTTPVPVGNTWYYVRVAVNYSHEGMTRDDNN